MVAQVGLQLPRDPVERQDELEKHVSASVEMLAEELSRGFSERFLKLLHFYARFRRYSARNVLLILLQRPDATRAASYKKWLDIGFQVKKGSRAIWIYGPVTKREQDAVTGQPADKIVGWRLVPVFSDTDLEDTESNALPILWQKLPDDVQHLVERATGRLADQSVTVTYKQLKVGLQGTAQGNRITLSTRIPDSRNRLATLLHEAGHSFVHFGATAVGKSEGQMELETEAATYVVLHQLGYDSPFSSDYLKSHGITPDQLRASLTVIGGISKRLLKLVEDDDKEVDNNNQSAA